MDLILVVMAEETRHDLEEIGTAASLMMDAVDKASQDLEDTVRSSANYLQAFHQTLANNFCSTTHSHCRKFG